MAYHRLPVVSHSSSEKLLDCHLSSIIPPCGSLSASVETLFTKQTEIHLLTVGYDLPLHIGSRFSLVLNKQIDKSFVIIKKIDE